MSPISLLEKNGSQDAKKDFDLIFYGFEPFGFFQMYSIASYPSDILRNHSHIRKFRTSQCKGSMPVQGEECPLYIEVKSKSVGARVADGSLAL